MAALPRTLAECQVVIMGLGLMGGSLAMALRGHCAGIFGIDPNPQSLQIAQEHNIVDVIGSDPALLIPQAHLIVLAAPVKAILAFIKDLPAYQPGPSVVMDLGSTKRSIVSAMQTLPERFEAIGGHPMCGKEKNTIKNAEATLYRQAPFALTPLERTTERARELALELVNVIGAHPVWIDAETHDQWVAATSHFPYLIANALAGVTPLEAAALAGPGLRSTIRVAGSSLTMISDIMDTNTDAILMRFRVFEERLKAIEAALRSGDQEALHILLEDGKSNYHELFDLPSEEHL